MKNHQLLLLAAVLGIFGCAKNVPGFEAPEGVRVWVLKQPSPAFIDQRQHLVYEVLVENSVAESITLESLEIDAGDFTPRSYESKAIAALMKLLPQVDADTLPDLRQGLKGPPSPGPGVIPAGTTAALFFWLSANADAALPERIEHRLKLSAQGRSIRLAVPVERRPPVVLSPPVSGDGWLAFQSPEDTGAHRRTILKVRGRHYLAQRFAIDWGRVGDEGRLVRPGRDQAENESFFAFGTPVLAVADGVVADVRTNLADNLGERPSETPVALSTVAGNSIVLDLGSGRFALYAHLKAGSIDVHKGQRVSRGQRLALLGNSGNSSAPHLHFHICDAPSALACEGTPYVFERFRATPVTMEGESLDAARARPSADPRAVEGQLTIAGHSLGFDVVSPR